MVLKRKRSEDSDHDHDRDRDRGHESDTDADSANHAARDAHSNRRRRILSASISPVPTTEGLPPPSHPLTTPGSKQRSSPARIPSPPYFPFLRDLVSRRPSPDPPPELAVFSSFQPKLSSDQPDLAHVNQKLEFYLSTRDLRQIWRIRKYGKKVATRYLPGLTPVHVKEKYWEKQQELEAEMLAETSDEDEDQEKVPERHKARKNMDAPDARERALQDGPSRNKCWRSHRSRTGSPVLSQPVEQERPRDMANVRGRKCRRCSDERPDSGYSEGDCTVSSSDGTVTPAGDSDCVSRGGLAARGATAFGSVTRGDPPTKSS